MDYGVLIIALLFMVLGILIGNKMGEALGTKIKTSGRYWACNIAVLLVGVVVSAFVSALGLLWLAGLTIGLIGGVIFGLKFGFGKSVGVWAKHDRMFRVNDDQVKAGEAMERGEDPDANARRELISVGPQGGGKDKASRRADGARPGRLGRKDR